MHQTVYNKLQNSLNVNDSDLHPFRGSLLYFFMLVLTSHSNAKAKRYVMLKIELIILSVINKHRYMYNNKTTTTTKEIDGGDTTKIYVASRRS